MTPRPTLNGVALVSQNDTWAVGEGGDIYHWDGTDWSSVASPTTNTLNAVSLASATDGWAVGEHGTILHWNGAVWQTYAAAPAVDRLHAVAMLSATDGWAVGDVGGDFSLGWGGMGAGGQPHNPGTEVRGDGLGGRRLGGGICPDNPSLGWHELAEVR